MAHTRLIGAIGLGLSILLAASPARAGTLSFLPNPLAFGSVNVSAGPVTSPTTVLNSGTTTVIQSIGLTGSTNFSVSPACVNAVLANGDTCDIQVTFDPSSRGSKVAILTVQGFDGVVSPYNANISGTGVAGVLQLAPSSNDFGFRDIAAGPTGSFSFTLTNIGDAPATVTSADLVGPNAGEFGATSSVGCLTPLSPSDTCTVDVAFDPSTSGAKSATLSIPYSGGEPAAPTPTAALTGIGTATVTGSLTPSPLDFGDRSLGAVVTLPLTLTNTGSGSLSVTNVAISGTNAGDFSQLNNCPPVLISGNSCQIDVTFTSSTLGARSASVDVTTDASPAIPSVPLTANGIANAPGKPMAVTAVAGQGTAEVSFTAPASDGGSAITSYTVTPTPPPPAPPLTFTGASSPITATGLVNGTSYTFTVTATNGVGTGPASDPSNSVTPQATAPAGLRVLARAGNGIALVDVEVLDDGGSPITGYEVTVSPGGATFPGATLPIAITGLSNGTLYTFTATATNSAGTSAVSVPSHTIRPFVPGNPISPLAYVPSLDDDDVYVIDTRDHSVITRVLVGCTPTGAVVSPVGTRAYIANACDDTVSVIDTTTQLAIATVPVGANPTGIAVNNTGTRVYVSNSADSTVSVIETAGNTVIDTVALVGTATSPKGIVVSPDGTRVYVSSGLKVRVIDTTTTPNTVVKTSLFGGTPAGIDVDATNSFVYVTNLINFRVNKLDTTNLDSLANSPSGSGSGHGIAVVPGGSIYAARTSADTVGVINPATMALAATVTVGDGPRGVGVTPNGAHVYVANENSANVSVIRTSDNTVIATVPVGFGAGALNHFIGPAVPPQPPTILLAQGGNGQATITFATPYDGGMPITSYTVTSSPPTTPMSGAASPITVTGLTNGTPYTFTVAATNAAGTGNASAPSLSVTPSTIPGPPTGLIATAGNAQATITYAAPASDGGSPITGYTASCSGGVTGSSILASTMILLGPLTNGTTYTCTVVAINANGSSVPSAQVMFTPSTAPAITSANAATFPVNTAGSFTVTATGIPSPTFSSTGSLPTGVTLAPGGLLSGTPALGTVGSYPLQITAANGALPNAIQAFTLTVAKADQTIAFTNPGPKILSATPLALVATATSTLAVTFSSVTTAVCTVSGSNVTMLTGGTCTLHADQPGDANYNAAPQMTQSFVITANPTRLGNISTRMRVGTGGDIMIGGFIIDGASSKRVAIVATGPSLTQYGIANALAHPTITLVRSADQSVVASNDGWQNAGNAAQLTAAGFAPSDALESAILIDLPPGAYTALVQGSGGGVGVGVVAVYEVDHPEYPLINISTRGQVLTGNDVMIGGFIINGSAPQTVAIVATGPSLTQYGIANALANPTLTLVRSSDQTVIASNDDWQTAANAAQLTAEGFAPGNPLESGILITLQPGAYTAILSGVGGGTGVGIIGVYAVD